MTVWKPMRSVVAPLLALAAAPALRAAEAELPKVMILGTFHFAGSSGDMIDVAMGDVLAERRQAEIAALVDRLAAFAPTKVAVELLPEHAAAFDDAYQAYRRDERSLAANERQQIGMRLARRMGHDRLYPIDAEQDLDLMRALAAAQAAGQEELLAAFQGLMAEVEATVSEVQGADRSILDAVRFHNSAWAHRGNSLYLLVARMGGADDPAGAEEVGAWYQRNLKIFANIARLVDGPEERILVVIGSGHLAQLASFFDESADHTWVSALDVLDDAD